MPTTCCVVNCRSRGVRDGIRFFKLPSELNFAHRIDLNELSKKRRQKWIQAIKRDDLTETKLKHVRVCNKHFLSGKPSDLSNESSLDWAPSVEMGYGNDDLTLKRSQVVVARQERSTKKIEAKLQKTEKTKYYTGPASTKRLCLKKNAVPMEVGGDKQRNEAAERRKARFQKRHSSQDGVKNDTKKVRTVHNSNRKLFVPEDIPTDKNTESKQLRMRATPNILKKNKNKTYVEDMVPEFLELKETTSNIIEVYIKEEEIDIEQHELENFESEIPQQSPQANILETTSDETVKKYEETCSRLAKQNEVLKQDFSKVMIENKIIKKNFLDFVTNSEELKNENKVLKEQLDKANLSSKKFGNGTNVENVIDLTDVNSVCRICLNKSLKLQSLSEALEFENPEIRPTNILGALTSLGLDSVAIEEHLPDKICFKCKEQLKLCITFKHTYSKSSEILKLFASSAFEKPEKTEDTEHAYAEKSYASIEDEHNEKINEDEQEFRSPEYCEVENSESIDNEDDKLLKKPVKGAKKTHTCPICFKELHLSQFLLHVHRHKGLKKYLDLKVSKKAKFYALPKNTVSPANEIEKFHSCPFCESSFQAAEYLEHVDNHLKNDSFSCDKCGRVFKKRSYLIQHMLVHTKELPYSCKTCNKGFVNKQNYEYHLLTHSHKDDELPYNCEHCNRKFSNPSHLARHMTIHLENCSYSSKYKMKRCRCCLQSFKSEDLLKSHRCTLTGVGLRICRLCKKTFASSKAYLSHLRLQHKIVKRTNRQLCGECNKVVSNITLHRMRMHPNSVRKSLCSVCGLYVVNIYNHRLKHEPLKCGICSKEFAHSSALKKHEKIHTGQKPFLCSSCPKTFNCEYNLQVHERIHKGDKCHVCPVCRKGFLEKSYLKKHMKIHKEISASTSTDGYGLDDDNYVIEEYGYLEGPPN